MTDQQPRPPTPDHDTLRTDLAGYVLGGLTVDEQRAVEAHLATCAECRAELAELDPIPVLLELAAPASATGTPATNVSAERTGSAARARPVPPARRTWGRVLVGAGAALAVAAALLVGVLIGTRVGGSDEPSFSTPIALQPVGSTSSSGTAALQATDTGTLVRLDLQGLPAEGDTFYECLWTSPQGTHTAGTFRAGPDGSAQVDLVTAARRYPGWSLQVVEHPGGAGEGRPVLEARA